MKMKWVAGMTQSARRPRAANLRREVGQFPLDAACPSPDDPHIGDDDNPGHRIRGQQQRAARHVVLAT